MTNNLKQFLEARALLPCPFCGGENLREDSECHGHGEYWPSVICNQCGAKISDYYGDARKAWNTRTPDRNLLAAFEQVCEALEALRDDIWDDKVCDSALTAAAPYRKLMGGV